ncbi:hypothetical protein AWC38_SpisGene24765, partial [Stylophora pistillata]
MRKEILVYLESNPGDSDGLPLLEHLADDEFACWDDHLTHMARDKTYGDQITMYAPAYLYNIDLQIVSTLGVGGQHVFSSSASVSAATVYLGHFAKNHGEHYINLEQFTDHNDGSEEDYEANDLEEGEASADYANKMQWIERWTVVREVEGSSPSRTNTQGLKIIEKNLL